MDILNITVCNVKTGSMVQLPPAEPPEANAIETFARLTTINSNTNLDQVSNNANGDSPPNSKPSSNNQSITILHQFSKLMEYLKNFTKNCPKQHIRNDSSSQKCARAARKNHRKCNITTTNQTTGCNCLYTCYLKH